MTWIVGAPVPFGYSIACADIRVTFSDGREQDCLQKIFQVGPVVCAAFAGSVLIGFKMLSRITIRLKMDEPGMAWQPDFVAPLKKGLRPPIALNHNRISPHGRDRPQI
jgi:hypothetical protein